MALDAAPVLIAYDGSEVSRAAIRRAAELFAGRPAVLATVWEPGLATVSVELSMGSPNMAMGARCPRIRRPAKRSIAASASTPRPSPPTGLSSLALSG
jgi:hypothetical protein